MERRLCVCKLSISALQGSIKSLLGLSDLFDTVESGKCCRCLALVNLKSQVWHVILSYRSSACCNNMSKHCTYIFTSEGNNVIGLIKITVLSFSNEHLISSNSGRLSVYSYYLYISNNSSISNNSVKKKFEKGRKVPGLLKKQAKRPLKISFKPCDI